MGRLQRKKTSSTKKKNKQSAAGNAAPQAKAASSIKKVSLFAVSSGESQKSPGLFQKKVSIKHRFASGDPQKRYIEKSLQFLREVKVELKKVTWPSRKQTIGATAVVIVVVMIISFFLGVVDIGLSSLIRVVLQ